MAAAASVKSNESNAVCVKELKKWLVSQHGVPKDKIKLDFSAGLYSSVEQIRAAEDVGAQQVRLFKDSAPTLSRRDLHGTCPPW